MATDFEPVTTTEDPLTAERYQDLLEDAGVSAHVYERGSAPEIGIPSAAGKYWEVRVCKEDVVKAAELIGVEQAALEAHARELENAAVEEAGGSQQEPEPRVPVPPGFRAAGSFLVVGAMASVLALLILRVRGAENLPVAVLGFSAVADWLVGKALLRGNRQARWVALARLLGGLLLAIGGGAVYAAQILLVTFSMGALLIGEPGAARLLAGKIAYVLVLGAVLIGAFWPLG